MRRFPARSLSRIALLVALVIALPSIAWADEPSSQSAPAAPAASATSSAAAASSEDGDEGAGSEPPDYSSWKLDDLKREVDKKTAEVERLQSKSDGLAMDLADVQATLDAAYAEMAGAKKVADRSVRERYKVQQHYASLFEVLLYAEDFQSFLAGIEYIEAASKVAVDDYFTLRTTVDENEREKARLEREKAAVDEELSATTAVLEEATAARDEEQRKADLVANAHLNPDGADWKASQEDFVDTWAPRIDEFLKGSPMEGQGEAFAKAAWKNHIDPRFSPAISTIESGKGRICIRPYNAWGWGAADPDPAGLALEWSSWEEAINAHVRGLSLGYGYTVSVEGAQKYCPPNWEVWYATTVDEMNRI